MFRLVSMAGAAALMASTAFADTTPTTVATPAAPASTTAASAKAAPPVVAATEKPATAAAEPKASEAELAAAKMRLAARKAQEARDDRLTAALNTLESKGYTSFQDLKAEGQNVAVVAIKNGKTTKVDVTPSGEVLPST